MYGNKKIIFYCFHKVFHYLNLEVFLLGNIKEEAYFLEDNYMNSYYLFQLTENY